MGGDTEMSKLSFQKAYNQLGGEILNRDYPVRRQHEKGTLGAEGERMQETQQVGEGGFCEEVPQQEEPGLSTNPQVGVGWVRCTHTEA